MLRIEQELAGSSPDRETVLTIGVFDGVHRGHHHLVSRLKALAKESRRLAGVVTFRNHPASVLSPDFNPNYLTGIDERLRLLKGLGVDFVVPVSFDEELSHLRAAEFAGLLHDRLKMKVLAIGSDFTMGRGRDGNAETLGALGTEIGFTVSVVEPLIDDAGHPVRSTTIREALAEGNVAHVSELLGRNFALNGTVVRGAGRGRPLGFPTANLKLARGMAVPGDGIYAAWCSVSGQRHMAATSIGVRPTFAEGEHTIEVFVLDFHGDLYGQEVRLELVRRLRDEVKFDTARELQDQVRRDVDQTRAILGPSSSRAER